MIKLNNEHTGCTQIEGASGDQLGLDISGRIDVILENPPEKSSLEMNNFITIEDSGVFINVPMLFSSYSFQTALTRLFSEGFYLENIDYGAIMNVLYDFDAIKSDTKANSIKIASSIKRFSDNRKMIYRLPRISARSIEAMYDFENEEIQVTRIDGGRDTQLTKIDIDEFIAMMWSYGISYGLDIQAIRKIIKENKPVRDVVIARSKPIVESKNASLSSIRAFHTDLGLHENLDGTLDMRSYIRPIVQVEKGEKLFKKNPLEYGLPGIDIRGVRLEPSLPKDLKISNFCGKGVHGEVQNNQEYIIAGLGGYPKISKARDGTVSFVEVQNMYMIDTAIGVKTGHIIATGDVVVAGGIDHDYFLQAGNVQISENLNGGIYATGNIHIAGSAKGILMKNAIKNRLVQKKNVRPGNGEIRSTDGNITIDGFIETAYVEAKKGKVNIQSLTHSAVIADVIEVNGDMTNSILMASTIVCKGKMTNCTIIARKNISLNTIISTKTGTNNIGIYSHDFHDSIEKNRAIRLQKISEIQEIEKNIDTEIVTKFNALTKIEEGKRRSMTRILVELMQDPKKLQEEQYKMHLAIYKMIGPILQRNGTNWEKVKKINDELTKISQEIQKEETLMNNDIKELSLGFKFAEGLIEICHITSSHSLEFLDFSESDVGSMIGLFEGGGDAIDITSGNTATTIKFHKKQIIPSSLRQFSWKGAV